MAKTVLEGKTHSSPLSASLSSQLSTHCSLLTSALLPWYSFPSAYHHATRSGIAHSMALGIAYSVDCAYLPVQQRRVRMNPSARMLAQSVHCTLQSSIHRLRCICPLRQPCGRFDFLFEGNIDLNKGIKLVI